MPAAYSEPYVAIVARGVERRGECLIFKGRPGNHGYGRACELLAHRVSYEKWHGPIPVGLVIDHLCHNEAAHRGECASGKCWHRMCVNPGHLAAVTSAVNGGSSPYQMKNWTHCKNGHEFTPENTYIKPGEKSRQCRICRKANAAHHGRRRTESGARRKVAP